MTDIRQFPCDLPTALKQAAIHLRAQSNDYRYGRTGTMDKHVRKAMAASYADWARLIEEHLEGMNNGR